MMQPPYAGIRTFGRGNGVVRLALTLLLVLNPLLAVIPTTVAAASGPVGQSAAAMPCHAATAGGVDASLPERQAQCPHCSGQAPPASCHCCGQTAPPGMIAAPMAVRLGTGTLSQRSSTPVAALPMSHREALYRPPKHS